ncbi:unnamed protein product [Lactuca virosa]|uniref:Uncharacterized protein n=1 Tax=Lactuca virosa TaxID=75947 RepID=A0AAU9PCU6_9ASTR|nr:unnamed protein product [Lactuca virosa]
MWSYFIISQTLLTLVLKEGWSAHYIWKSLEEVFHDKKEACTIELENELFSMTLGNRTITYFYAKMTASIDIMANISVLVPKRTLVTHLLNALTPRFDNIANLIQHWSPFPLFLYTRSILNLEESRLNHDRPSHTVHSDYASSLIILNTSSIIATRDNRPTRSSNNCVTGPVTITTKHRINVSLLLLKSVSIHHRLHGSLLAFVVAYIISDNNKTDSSRAGFSLAAPQNNPHGRSFKPNYPLPQLLLYKRVFMPRRNGFPRLLMIKLHI